MWRMRSCPPTLDSSAFTWRPIVRWVDFSRGSSPRKPTAHSVVRPGREHLQHRARMWIRPFSGHDKIAMLDHLAARIVVTNLPGCIVRRHVSRSSGDAVVYAVAAGQDGAFVTRLVRRVREYRLWAPEWGLGNHRKTLSRRNPPISVTSAKGRLRSIRPSWLSNVAWPQ